MNTMNISIEVVSELPRLQRYGAKSKWSELHNALDAMPIEQIIRVLVPSKMEATSATSTVNGKKGKKFTTRQEFKNDKWYVYFQRLK